MKKKTDRVRGSVGVSITADPGVSLFWLDDSFDGTMPLTAPAPRYSPRGPDQQSNESATRSALKALSWRLFGTTWTMVVIYVLTGSSDLALTVGYLDAILKMGLYYLHERFWNRLRVGKRENCA